MSMGPDAPDPGQTAMQATMLGNQQSAANKQAGIESQAGSWADQYNPYGSITRRQIGTGPGGVPLYATDVSLSPTQQGLFDVLMGAKGTAGTAGAGLLAGANYGAQPASDVIGNMESGMVGERMLKQQQYLDPFFTTQRDQLDTKLKNQGLIPGTPAYDNAMRGLDTSQGLTVAKAASDYANDAYKNATGMYTLPAQLALALGQYGAPGSPTQMGVQAPGLNLQPANYIGAYGAANQAAMDSWKAQYQQNSDMMSGLFGIPTALVGGWAGSPAGGAAITSMLGMLSDRRLKENIVKIGELHNGLNVYGFNFIGDSRRQIGLMADEVEEVMPEAVGERDGYKTVNYAMVLR